jgi:hypothetical protein
MSYQVILPLQSKLNGDGRFTQGWRAWWQAVAIDFFADDFQDEDVLQAREVSYGTA